MKKSVSLKGLLYLLSLVLFSSLSHGDQPLSKITMVQDLSVDSALRSIQQSFGFFSFPIYDEGSPRLRLICPKFKEMNGEEKENFWMNFWRQLILFESSGEMVTAKAVHAKACGYLQLHCEQKKRELGVKPEFRENCMGDVQSNTLRARMNNIRCGMAMLQQQVDMAHEIFPDKDKQNYVYWQPIRNPKHMYARICRYTPCGNSKEACQELTRQRAMELK